MKDDDDDDDDDGDEGSGSSFKLIIWFHQRPSKSPSARLAINFMLAKLLGDSKKEKKENGKSI